MECRMDHIVLNVEDDEAMLTFYTEVLGLASERLTAYRAGEVPFPSLRLSRDTIIDLFPRRMWQKGRADVQGRAHLNHFCLCLKRAEWDALQERLARNGIAVQEGPVQRWGARGAGVSIYFQDPEHNLIEARYYADADSSDKCLLGS